MASIQNVRFEHYLPGNTLGVHEKRPRISWSYQSDSAFQQESYNIEVSEHLVTGDVRILGSTSIASEHSYLVPWPLEKSLGSRQRVSVKIQGVSKDGHTTSWSDPAIPETGLMDSSDWQVQRIASSRPKDAEKSQPEELFRKLFDLESEIVSARLYITAQGVYEAEINGKRVGDYFLAPGWTEYEFRLQYQTYDVSGLLTSGKNCIGVRVAEGWFNGRIGFEGGRRNIWGTRNTLMAQLEVTLKDGSTRIIVSDDSWVAAPGPTVLAEIYDGEKYDATKEVDGWSTAQSEGSDGLKTSEWSKVEVIEPLPKKTELVAGYGEPVRGVEAVKPVEQITTPSDKTILDFNQNLVGYLRIKQIKGTAGHKITLKFAEVLENGELGTRPLRDCKATDEYTLKGAQDGESWEPRFSFHGFRYAQVENWPKDCPLMDSVEAVVCHTDMLKLGNFECSDSNINKLYQNVCWSMRGNFLSIPTDCPQRDERLGWTGDLALFAPTATFIYQCAGILKNWLLDFTIAQQRQDGLPATVVPDALVGHKFWDLGIPLAIWHDVAILGPWTVFSATGDVEILRAQYQSMQQWIGKVVRYNGSKTPNLWHPKCFQLGDWLDPAAPPDAPWKSATDSKLASDAFLIQSLRLISSVARIIGEHVDAVKYEKDFVLAREQFQAEWTSPNGRLICESQTAYALAIHFDLLTKEQRVHAGERLAHIVRLNEFKIGTGFAGTPYVCEALAQTGHVQVAFSMLLNQRCPSWLYPISMGATTTWERWDSMLPDGSINPGEMTSFNHYAFGAVVTFLHERIAGLICLEPGWKKVLVEPLMGAEFTSASASHITPHGELSVSWKITDGKRFNIYVVVPGNVIVDLVIPDGVDQRRETLKFGKWSFETEYQKTYEWPVTKISPLPF